MFKSVQFQVKSDKKLKTNCPTGCEVPLKDNKKYAKNVKSFQFSNSTN